jgi:Large polyvalent protein associated domain 22
MAENQYLDIVRQEAVQSAVNPYSQFVDAGDGAAGTPGRLSMMQVADRNPDVEARLQALAKQYAVPVDSVRLQEPDYQRRATVDSIDYQTLARDYPTTAGMIYDTQKAAVSYDDTPNLSAIEKGVRFLTNSGRALVSAVPNFNASAWGVAQAGADALATLTSPLAGTLLPENPFERVSRGIAELRQKQDQTTKDVMPKGTGVLDSGWYSGLQSLGQMALALPAAVTGQPQAALGILSGITGGQAYGEARDKGLPFQQALPFAASQAAIEYATEKIPVARFLTDIRAGTPFYSMLARNMAAEVPGEQVATILQDLNEWAVLNPEKPFSSYIEERPSAAAQTLIATLVASGGAVSTAKGVELAADRLRGRNSAVQQGMQDGETLAQLSEAAAASKLRARDPETFREFVAQAAEDGPVQDVYIDVSQLQALAQSGVDLSALAAASPSVAEQLPVAAATGGMVRIPIDEYATTVAGTEIGDALLPHLKTDPAGMTRAEAETYMQDQAGQLQEEVERTLTEQAPQDQFNTSRAVVEQQMLEQLNQVNRFTEDVNRSYAAMMANFYGVQALRLGITPEEMAARYPLRVQAVLEQGTSNGLPNATANDRAAAPAEPGAAAAMANESGAAGDVPAIQPDQQPAAVEGTTTSTLNQNVPRGWGGEGLNERTDVPPVLGGNTRGAVSFGKDITQQPTVITLLQNADLSTFLHESGHFYLEVLTDIARRPDAPQEIKDDVQALLDWFGVPDLATWDSYDLEQKRSYHEQLARGFEAYLFEGKAPSVELQGVFARFRAWMINVYRSLQALNVSLTDEVRSVFDRMVASSDAIAEMQAVRGMAPLFESAEAAGMSPDEWQAYQNLGAEAQADATTQLEARSLRDMRWLSNARSRTIKAMQKEAEAKRAGVREEVAAEVYATPLYGSMQFLKRGTTTAGGEVADMTDVPHKLSIEALTDMYGGEADKFALLDWSKLGYGQYGMLAREGLHPDVVAQMFGYTSGDQLVHALLEAEPVDQVIDRMTDQRMLERFGDLSDPAAIQRAADLAVHNEGRAKFVATELNALNRATGQRQVLVRAARQFAEAAIARLRVRDIKPSQYAVAEAKAARAAQEALRKDDLATAAVQKRNQLVNNYATRAAYAARGEVDKSVEYLTKFDREGVRKNVDPAYLDQIDGLLERFDLRKGTTLRELEKRKSLLEWVQSQEEQGLQPVIDPALIDEANRKSYKDMTLEELRGLTDAVKNIEHLGRLKKKLLTAKDQREFQAVADAIAEAITDNAKGVVAERRISDRGPLVDVASLFRNFLADHRKFASVVRQFDGWKDGGVAWEYLVRNMNEAGDFEAVENEKATLKLQELFAPVLAGGKLTAKTYFPALDKSFTREERIGMALNMGNEVNRERVLSGERLSPGQLQGVLDTLTKEDWDFVQSVWDYLESFRPQIAAKEKRLTGVEPAWVEPTPVQTKFGEYKGGYYPIKYDPLRSTRAEADTNAEVQRQIERGMYTRAMTRRGHLKERSESTGRPIRYDMNVVFEHVQQVVHDLAWHEYLVDANRLLRAGVVDSAIRAHYGPEINRTLRDTLRDVAIGNMGALDSLDKLMNHLRTGSTIVGLGWRVTTSLLQPLGLTQTAARIGTKWMLKGIKHWAGDSLRLENSAKQIYGMSDFMRLRAKTMQREINEIRNKVQGKDSKLQASYFYLIQKAQLIADIPTWWGAYEKAMAENGMTEERAIALADQAVIDTQGGGQVKDLAAIQRGGAGKKLFTSFYSFFNTTYNLTAEVVGRTDFRKPRDVAMLVCDLLLLYTIPAAVSTLVKAALHGDDDDEKLLRNLIADQLNYLFGTMVLLREAGAAVQATTGTGGVDYTGPAAVRFFAELAKLGKQVQQGEADEAFWKAMNSVAGIIFHYPAGQINATVSGINALADGKTENPGALLVGAPPKK